jgi:hypothetical protein
LADRGAARSQAARRRAGAAAGPGGAGEAASDRRRGQRPEPGRGRGKASRGRRRDGERARQAFEAAKVDYRYLPACSPDRNPIEPCWSKLKGGLRAKAAQTLEALETELGLALATITAQDAQGWFRLCGYTPPN